MEKLIGGTPGGMGLAATAVLSVLPERLIKSGALTPAEVADILREARNERAVLARLSAFASSVQRPQSFQSHCQRSPVPLAQRATGRAF